MPRSRPFNNGLSRKEQNRFFVQCLNRVEMREGSKFQFIRHGESYD
jgi:hypothetical protein